MVKPFAMDLCSWLLMAVVFARNMLISTQMSKHVLVTLQRMLQDRNPCCVLGPTMAHDIIHFWRRNHILSFHFQQQKYTETCVSTMLFQSNWNNILDNLEICLNHVFLSHISCFWLDLGAMDSSLAVRRLVADPNNSIKDLMQVFQDFVVQCNNYDFIELLNCPGHCKWSWKTSPNAAWMCKMHRLIISLLDNIAPNGV